MTEVSGAITTDSKDLPPTGFDDMSKEDAVASLSAIKQQAHYTVQSGDLASSNSARTIGTIAHVLLQLLGHIFPETEPFIEEGEAIDRAVGDPIGIGAAPVSMADPPPPGNAETPPKRGFFGI